VVIGAADPDPRVDRQGIARLRAAGLTVETGVLEAEARETLAGFIQRIATGRPMVTLKLATTLDGRIATAGGESQWITGTAARRMAHALRGIHDAVMVGAGTAVADDPELTCRIAGFRPTPVVRVVADSHLRTPLTARLVRKALAAPTWFLIRDDADPRRQRGFREAGVRLIPIQAGPMGVDTEAALAALGQAGLTRVLVEGGGQLAAALLRAGLVDRIAWFHAPAVIGGDGWPGVQAFGVEKLAAMPRFERTRVTLLGEDVLSEFIRRG
jgi:diaminohydroxyphosphoribosylaminopyrimidine deaminase/5-amino-6-(5-phosphoribosylamino)uracil reductase